MLGRSKVNRTPKRSDGRGTQVTWEVTGLMGQECSAVFSQGLWAFPGSSKTGISLNKPLRCENRLRASIPGVSQVVSSKKEAGSQSRHGGHHQAISSGTVQKSQTQGQPRTLTLLQGERGHLPGLPYGLQRQGPPCRPRGLPSQETTLWAQRRPCVWCLQPSPSVVGTEQVLLRGLAR